MKIVLMLFVEISMPISSVTRNNNCIRLTSKYAQIRSDLKKQVKECRFNKSSMLDRIKLAFKLASLPRSSSKVRIRNRCSITGRGRGVFRYFKLCGAQIRSRAMKGMLPGVKHASW
jgi:small subunit ribosomal protein S14